MEGQQAIHKDSIGKSLSSKRERATKPITNPPRGMPCHNISTEPNPRVEISLPWVTTVLVADNHAAKKIISPPKQGQVAQAPATCSQSGLPRENMQLSAATPNYISQDEDDDHTPKTCTTRSQSIMQQAMLS
jgi:hypothetical protein